MRARHRLLDTYRRLASVTDAHGRGVAFEQLVTDLFRSAHFHVSPNAKAARPRQSDLVAVLGRETYLIETKWEATKADVDDVDGLRIRLQETHAPVTGVLVSVAGFGRGAVERVESRRDRPVLLISGTELETVLDFPQGLRPLLRRKMHDLVVDGVAQLEQVVPATRGRAVPPPSFPRSRSTIVDTSGKPLDLSGEGGFDELVFVADLPDVDWVAGSGQGVTLDISPQPESELGLIQVLAELAGRGWVTEDGRWSIQQAHVNWHGTGCHEFVEAVQAWEERYARLDHDVHHTEQIAYADGVEGLLYTVAADLRANEVRRVDHCNISFQLSGVPIDPSPIREVAAAFGVEQSAFFRPMVEPALTGRRLHGEERPRLEPLGYVVEGDDLAPHAGPPVVTGVVAENPFRRGGPSWWPTEGADAGILISWLKSWHPFDEPRSAYYLMGAEWTRTSDVLLLRPIVDWEWEDTELGRPPWEGKPRRTSPPSVP